MRILYALNTFHSSIDGVAISIERQARGLAARGHMVAVVTPGNRLADFEENLGAVHVYRVRALRLWWDHWLFPVVPEQSVDRIMGHFRPDVVVVSVPGSECQSA